ncbi:hypothetical protein DVH24_018822 [Malus domestica]|uniref:RNase H type-1 domain-containing protein n=1 Tax=Malus domestica TaxID=3750 RepID=A0A498HPX3_MALDO|nr:hypothetical protein DVH24_018822 [Malus domestica]
MLVSESDGDGTSGGGEKENIDTHCFYLLANMEGPMQCGDEEQIAFSNTGDTCNLCFFFSFYFCHGGLRASIAFMAGALAVLECCKFAKNRNCQDIIVESDSQNIIRWLKMEVEDGNWEIFPIMEIRNVFQVCHWSWVPRTGNTAAHSFALQFDMGMTNLVWLNRPPSSWVHLLNKDGLPSTSETTSYQSKSRI